MDKPYVNGNYIFNIAETEKLKLHQTPTKVKDFASQEIFEYRRTVQDITVENWELRSKPKT